MLYANYIMLNETLLFLKIVSLIIYNIDCKIYKTNYCRTFWIFSYAGDLTFLSFHDFIYEIFHKYDNYASEYSILFGAKINYIHLSIYKFNINNITFLSNSCEIDFFELYLCAIRLFRRH